jgi:hypothetical protein
MLGAVLLVAAAASIVAIVVGLRWMTASGTPLDGGQMFFVAFGVLWGIGGVYAFVIGEPLAGLLMVCWCLGFVLLALAEQVDQAGAAPRRETLGGEPVVVIEVPRDRARVRTAALGALVLGLCVFAPEIGAIGFVLAFAAVVMILYKRAVDDTRLVIGERGISTGSGDYSWKELGEAELQSYRGKYWLKLQTGKLGLGQYAIDPQQFTKAIVEAARNPSKRDTLYLKLNVSHRRKARSRQAS